VQIKREHGGVVFVDLRDRTGIVQLVFSEQHSSECFKKVSELKQEYVISARGEVRKRENPNPELETGNFEVWVDEYTVLNGAKTPPIGVIKQSGVSEELRLKYRYIDLRRAKMKENILMRHRIVNSIRGYLNEMGYIDIETPFLTKSTPEGARDFLVPSRLNPARFYALPQSPQIFKQLLMVAGFEKYYQIVRCFRDEDLRADRQPEFTQIDIEASFIEEEDIYRLVDGMFVRILHDCYGIALEPPVKRLPYDTVMERYGTDRPDLRYELEIRDLFSFQKLNPKEFIREGFERGKRLYGLRVDKTEGVTRKTLDSFTDFAKKNGADLFTWLRYVKGEESGPMMKLFGSSIREAIEKEGKNDFILLAAFGLRKAVLPALGWIRQEIARILGLTENDHFAFCWITDFPLFEWSDEENKIVSVHHPFTSPKEEDVEALEKDPFSAKSKSYDFVLNGIELGGGSIRIHRNEVQKRVFSVLGLEDDEIRKKFGFLLEALQYGAPPHGGIAFGLDRIVMMLQKEESIRDVIPFPKTASGTCPLTGAPDAVSTTQLSELGIHLDETSRK
jgi:aspartyl-tRNA synthetase